MPLEGAAIYGEEQLGRPGRRPEVIDDDDDDDDAGGACVECCRRCGACVRSCVLTVLICFGMAAGIGVGIVLRYTPPYDQPTVHPRYVRYLVYPVELFTRFTGFLLVPFVASSLVTGSGSLKAASSVKVGLRTLTYYVATSILAVGEALGFVYAIRPGKRSVEKQLVRDSNPETSALEDWNPIDMILDLFRNLFPDNMVTSMLYLQHTKTSTVSVAAPNGTTVNVESFSLEKIQTPNVVGVAFYSILFGLALAKLGEKGRVVQLFFNGVCEAILTLVRGMLWLFPISAIFFMADTIVRLSDPLSELLVMFMFSLTVLLGLFTHMFLVLPIIYVVMTRRNPFRLLYFVFRALLVGFITNSSTVTMPVTVDCLENAGVDPRVARWMCPVGAIINVDGFAIYQAMACVFIATIRGVAFDASTIAILGFMTVAVSLIRPVSGSNSAVLVILFHMLGLPVQDIYLLVPFDWMLARFRTVVNIWSDAIGNGIVDKCSKADLNRNPGGNPEDRGCPGLDHPTDGAVLTGYGKRKDWTVRLVNPYGDRMVVSKV